MCAHNTRTRAAAHERLRLRAEVRAIGLEHEETPLSAADPTQAAEDHFRRVSSDVPYRKRRISGSGSLLMAAAGDVSGCARMHDWTGFDGCILKRAVIGARLDLWLRHGFR